MTVLHSAPATAQFQTMLQSIYQLATAFDSLSGVDVRVDRIGCTPDGNSNSCKRKTWDLIPDSLSYAAQNIAQRMILT